MSNYTGDDTNKLALCFAAAFRSGKADRGGPSNERRFFATFKRFTGDHKMPLDEDGKDLIERAGNADKIIGH